MKFDRQSRIFLGIDWKVSKMEAFRKLLEDKGYEADDGKSTENIKKLLMETAEKAKKNIVITRDIMCTILRYLDSCDHHDLGRLDLILTCETNKNDNEFQWGSVILGLKWEI